MDTDPSKPFGTEYLISHPNIVGHGSLACLTTLETGAFDDSTEGPPPPTTPKAQEQNIQNIY